MTTTFHQKQASQVTAGMPTEAGFTGQVCVDSTGDPDVYVNLGGDNWHDLSTGAAAHEISGAKHTGVVGTTEDKIVAFDVDGYLKQADEPNNLTDFQLVGEELETTSYSQDDVPDLSGVPDCMALWEDTNDSDRVFLIFYNSDLDQQMAVELA